MPYFTAKSLIKATSELTLNRKSRIILILTKHMDWWKSIFQKSRQKFLKQLNLSKNQPTPTGCFFIYSN